MMERSGNGESADVVLAAIRAVETRSAEALQALYHPDVEFHWPPGLPYSGVWRGAGLAEMTQRFRQALDPLQPTEEARRMDPVAIGSGECGYVVTRYTLRCVNAEGERFETETLAEYEVRDGRIRKAQMYYFDLTGLAQVFREAAA